MLPLDHKSVLDRLAATYKAGDELLKSRKLHLRTKNLNTITDKRARRDEERRQNFPYFVGDRFHDRAMHIISQLENSDELLHLFEYVDLEGQSMTSANLIELRMQALKKIIALIREHPDKYIPEGTPLSKLPIYNQATGELSQAGRKPYPLQGAGKDLIDYLWGKRQIQSGDEKKTGRAVSRRSVLEHTGISSQERLKAIVDNFNQQVGKRKIDLKIQIQRSSNTVQIVVISVFSASL